MTCEPGCGEMEEFMIPASTGTSITLHVEDMCQPGVAGLDELQVIGGFAERGKVLPNRHLSSNKITLPGSHR